MPSLMQDHSIQQTPLIKGASTRPTGPPPPLSFQTPALPVTRESLGTLAVAECKLYCFHGTGIFSPLDGTNSTPDVMSSFVTERSHTRPQPSSAFSSSTTAQQPSSSQPPSISTLSTPPLHSQPSLGSVSTPSPHTHMDSCTIA